MKVLHSKPRNALPGDQVRILTAAAVDYDGRRWPPGTEFTPSYAGASMLPEFTSEQRVVIEGRVVRFYR